MKRTISALVPIEKYDANWLALCLDAGLIYEEWSFDDREEETLLPIASKTVDGAIYEGRFWWTNKPSADPCPAQSASHLVICIEPSDDSTSKPQRNEKIVEDLVKQIEDLKPGTIADMPFTAGGHCLEE